MKPSIFKIFFQLHVICQYLGLIFTVIRDFAMICLKPGIAVDLILTVSYSSIIYFCLVAKFWLLGANFALLSKFTIYGNHWLDMTQIIENRMIQVCFFMFSWYLINI